ncbi:hypothetical protein ACJJTC_016208 [Scirpophaga incertulas]
MATLIQSYEQQYSVLTADITAKIGKLKSGTEENREKLSKEIQGNFDEANDLLEQLELESRSMGGASRVAAYRAELQRVRAEYRAVIASDVVSMDNEEVYDDWSGAGEQRQKLLDNSERLERTGKALTEGYRVAIETEQIGAAVLQDLGHQRETIQRSRGRLRETDEQLDYSRRLLNSMQARNTRQRLAVAAALAAVLFVAGGGIYLSLS